MKRRIISGLAAVCFLLTGCSTGSNVSVVEEQSEPAAETTAESTTETDAVTTAESTTETTAETTAAATEETPEETEPETAETEAPAEEAEPVQESGEWRQAYADVLRGCDVKRFSLLYIDNDDIPELVLHWGEPPYYDHASTNVEVYTYYNGAAVSAGTASTDGYSYFGYNEREGIVFDSFIAQGHYRSRFCELRDGALQVLCETESDDDGNYKVDGVQVTAAEHHAVTDRYQSPNYKNEQGEYDNNEASIQACLLS